MARQHSTAGCSRGFARAKDHGGNHGRYAGCAARARSRPHRGTVVDSSMPQVTEDIAVLAQLVHLECCLLVAGVRARWNVAMLFGTVMSYSKCGFFMRSSSWSVAFL